MKIIKPLKLALLTRCFEQQQRYTCGVSIMAFVPLSQEPHLFSEMELWKFTAQELGKDGVLDVGIPKVKGEYLVTGSAFVPGRESRQGCPVRTRVGGREKKLHIFGDRFWRGNSISDPLLFTAMPLDWAHTFGGNGYEQNPMGKGFCPVTANNVTLIPLPNVQYASQTIATPDDRPSPACFGPVDFTWPQRFSKAGTYDDTWLKEDMPGFAQDIDWTIFNIASPDQWFDEPLKGDEPYLFENMHPSIPLLEGRLPGLSARCFINRESQGNDKSFSEVPMGLTTVWFFPHAERAVLIYHGAVEVEDENGADISQIMIGCEYSDRPKHVEHYRQVLTDRLDKENGHLKSMRDVDLLPLGMNQPVKALEDEKSLTASAGLLTRNLRNKAEAERNRSREIVAGLGLDPDQYGPPPLPSEDPPPDPDDLAEYMEKVNLEMENQKNEAEKRRLEQEQNLERLVKDAGMDYDAFKEQQKAASVGPPKFSAEATLAQMTVLMEEARKGGVAMPEFEAMLADPAYRKNLEENERKLKDAYRMTAHHQVAAPGIDGSVIEQVRREVMEIFGKGGSFAGADLTGADLSGLDLPGANFEGAFLESVTLDYANLAGANLKNAVLAHSSLEGAILDKGDLTDANLGKAKLAKVRAHGADFGKATLVKADFTGADFSGAILTEADCTESRFADTDFSHVQAERMIFNGGSLLGLKLSGARLDKCNFIKADVSGVDFSNSSLNGATFMEVTGEGASFRDAEMIKTCFVQKSCFKGADFAGARLVTANLRGSDLDNSDFSGALLDGADLSECSLRNARLHLSVARDAQFVKADMSDADVSCVNAMNASFQRADIRGVDFRGSNLFQVDLARVRADKGTDLTDALIKKARVYPKRRK
jgi:uncharacterized protein YjbI with pentapeptide repeats